MTLIIETEKMLKTSHVTCVFDFVAIVFLSLALFLSVLHA